MEPEQLEGSNMASGDCCLCLDGQEGPRNYFHTTSAFVQKFLQEGFLPGGCLKPAEPQGQFHCRQNALSPPPPPISSPLCSCPQDNFFVNQTIGTKKSTSQLTLVTSAENGNEGLSHHLLHACVHGPSNAVQLVITTEPGLNLDAPLSCGSTNEQGFTPLSAAVLSNVPQVCGLLIKAGAGVNSTDALERSSLHWAVLANHLSSVKLLIKNGASAELIDKQGLTPLMYACILRSADIVTTILKESRDSCGVGIPHKDSGATPLMLAALQGSPELVKLLLKHGAQLSQSDKHGLSVIHYAVWGGDLKCVKLVVGKSGRVALTQRDRWGRTPLLVAAAKGDVSMCQFLLKKGALLTEVDEGGRTVIHWSVLSQQNACLQFLLTYHTSSSGGQALVHQADNEGATPIHYAAISTDHDILTALLDKGATQRVAVAQADHSGLSPLVWAAVCGSVPAVELLLEANDGGISTAEGGETGGQVKQESLSGVSDRGSPTNEGEMKGEESGQEVASDINDKEQGKEEDKQESLSGTNNGDIPKEEQVIGEDNGKGALSSNNDGAVPVDEEQDCHKEGIEKAVLQPLQAAACVGSKEVCLVLINSGAKVNSTSPTGLTPLHYASRFGHTECAQLLLERQASVDATTPQQETGLHLACRYGHAEVSDQLLLHKAKIDCPLPPHGDCPVHLTCSYGHHNVLRVLVRHGCNVDERRGSDEQSALHLASSHGHLSCCKVLVNHGCNTEATLPTLERLTALDVALLNGHSGVADFLISCHAPTRGGAYHRAACTIQAVWRFYRHKCRMATARHWCAAVIQRAIRLWLGRRRARRLRLARERARHNAAATIQFHWKVYIAQKRRYESTYAKLKARLERERVAAELIITELQYQRHSVELPTTAPVKVKSFTLPTQSSPTNPRYLLKATANPVAVFPSSSLLFPAKPHRPLLRRMPNIRITTKPTGNDKQHFLTQSPVLEVDGGEPSHPDDQVKSGEGLCLPPVKTNSSFRTSRTKENEETRDGHTRRASCGSVKLPAALVTSSNETNDRSSPATHTTNGLQEETKDLQSMPTSSDSIKLPAIPRNGSLVAIKCDEATAELRSSTSREIVLTKTKDKSSLSHDGALKPAEGGKNKKSVAHSSSAEQLPLTRQSPRETSKRTENPIKFQSQMKVTRQSTFKDTPLGYKPVTGSKQRGNSRDNTTISRNSNQLNTASASQPIREQLTRDSPTGAQDQNSGSMEQLTTEDPHRVASHSPHPLNLSRHLYQQAQRYDKLNHVLALLEQAKDSKNVEGEGSKPGTPPVKITELKTHIKTALDEAVRLRADTEALQHRVLNGDSGPHNAGTVTS